MQYVREYVQELRSSTFLRHNTVFFFGSLLVGVLNYAYYPVVGRLLSASDYGEVQALISLFTQLTVFLGVLSLVTVNIVANYKNEIKKQSVTFELEKLGLIVSIAIFLVGLLFGSAFASFFHFNSVWPLRVMLLAFVVSVPLTFRTAFLRGHKKFGQLSITEIIGAGSEILLAAVLILLGYGAVGAIAGLVMAQLTAYVYAMYRTHQIGFARPPGSKYFKMPKWQTIAPEAKYSIFVLFISLTITVLSSADIFVVKHYFNPEVAGLYAGVSIIGRIIFFLTGPISGVLLPLVKIHKRDQLNQTLLLKSLGLLGLIGGSALLVFAVFPTTIISILMGHKYLVFAHLLPELSLAMFLFSIVNMLMVYSIALRQYHISAIVAIGIVLTVILMLIRHHTVGVVVTNLVYSSVIFLSLFGIWNLTCMLRGKVRYAQ